MSTLTPIITDAGITALIDAKNRGMSARIAEVAVGDGQAGAGSGPYTASQDMTALKHEIQRVVVAGGELIGNRQNQLHLTAILQDEGTDVPNVYPIYEIGFFLETGELFALYAANDEKLAEKVASTDFMLAFDLTFSGADAGDIVIDGSGKLEAPAARDTLLLGPNTVKIHSQAEFDQVFNLGTDTVIAANSTIALSPIQGAYEPNDSGRWQVLQAITAFANATNSPNTKVTCTAAAHGLDDGTQIVITQSAHHNGHYSISNVTANGFDINAHFIADGTAKWGTTSYSAISAFADSATETGAKVVCTSAGHGLSDNTTVLIGQSRYYSGTYTISDVTTDSFAITTPFIGSDIASGAWGGMGDNPQNTFNGRPAYILKNSVELQENVSIIGFNQEDTVVVKDNAQTRFTVQGSAGTPVTGIQLRGWSFDGRGGVDGFGGALIGTDSGGAFFLDYCEQSELNCKIINHNTRGNGGGLYGANAVKQITATQLHHNKAANGGGVYQCDHSTLTVYDCTATSGSGSGAHSCDKALLRLFNCTAQHCNNSQVIPDGDVFQLNKNDGTAALTVDNTGNVDLSGDLVVSGTVGFSLTQRQMINMWGTKYGIGIQSSAQYFRTGDNFAWYKGGSHSNTAFDAGTDGTVQMVIKDGNVGIGTASPAAKLAINGGVHIGGNSDPGDNNLLVDGKARFGSTKRQMIDLYSTSYGIGIQYQTPYFRTAANFAWYKGGSHNDGALNAGTGGTVQMVIKDGNVGIGTASPAAKLAIDGGVHIGGNSDPGDNNLLVDGKARFGSTTRQMIDLYSTAYGIGIQSQTQYFRTAFNFAWYKDGSHSYTALDAGTDGTVQMVINDDGNVGIGTASPDAKLAVNGGVHIGGNSDPGDNNLLVDGKARFGSAVRQMIDLYSTAYGIGIQNNTQYFRTALNFAWYKDGNHNDDELNAGTGGTVQMVIKDGNVGIGTASPDAKLVVDGDATVTGDLKVSGGDIKDAGGTDRISLPDNGNLTLKDAGGTSRISIADGGALQLHEDDGTAALTVDSEGNVDLSGDLAVSGKMDFDQDMSEKINLFNAGYGIGIQHSTQYFRTAVNFAWFKGGSHNDGVLNAGTGGTVQMVIKDGNVGIGTASPAAKLAVNGGVHIGGNSDPGDNNLLVDGKAGFGSTVRQMIDLYSTSYGIGIQSSTQYFRTGANFAWYKGGSHSDTALAAGTGGTVQMVIKDGNVGIGTDSPKAKLDVSGDIHINSAKPFIFRRYSNLGDNIDWSTGYSTSTYSAAIIGFQALDGDIQEDNDGDIIQVYMRKVSGSWYIRADFRTHNDDESWSVDVMFVNKHLVEEIGY